ncbi:unnamed protein product [Ilex paraguariensis]|uniref:Uncharacterized protein n=1 Tax=Ilex paraguariensis TaxID=185542 RepID=A0ABC8U4Y0_9AQUA
MESGKIESGKKVTRGFQEISEEGSVNFPLSALTVKKIAEIKHRWLFKRQPRNCWNGRIDKRWTKPLDCRILWKAQLDYIYKYYNSIIGHFFRGSELLNEKDLISVMIETDSWEAFILLSQQQRPNHTGNILSRINILCPRLSYLIKCWGETEINVDKWVFNIIYPKSLCFDGDRDDDDESHVIEPSNGGTTNQQLLTVFSFLRFAT